MQAIGALHAAHYSNIFSHVSLKTEYNAVRAINYTILRGCLLSVYVLYSTFEL